MTRNRASAKQAGTAWETAIVNYLIEQGWEDAERRRLSGVDDRGDVSGVKHVMIEAKNEKTVTLGAYMAEVEKETVNAKARFGAAWIKRRGFTTPAKGYVVMSGEQFVALLKAAGL